MIKVSVVGAKGRMGSHVVEAVNNAEDTQLALALDAGDDLTQITTDNTDVVVEFTVPSVSLNNVLTLIGQGVDVVVGTALMARLPLPAEGEDVPVLQALEDVAVRPTSQQTLVFLGKDFSLEHTAEEAQDLRFAGAGGSLLLKDASGRTLGAVTGIYLPTDETSVKPLDET